MIWWRHPDLSPATLQSLALFSGTHPHSCWSTECASLNWSLHLQEDVKRQKGIFSLQCFWLHGLFFSPGQHSLTDNLGLNHMQLVQADMLHRLCIQIWPSLETLCSVFVPTKRGLLSFKMARQKKGKEWGAGRSENTLWLGDMHTHLSWPWTEPSFLCASHIHSSLLKRRGRPQPLTWRVLISQLLLTLALGGLCVLFLVISDTGSEATGSWVIRSC